MICNESTSEVPLSKSELNILENLALFTLTTMGPKTGALIKKVERVGKRIEKLAQPKRSILGKGGMTSKIQAAKIAARAGIKSVVANGRGKDALIRIVKGRPVGTLFLPVK